MAAANLPTTARSHLKLPFWGAFGVQANDIDRTVAKLADEKVGAYILLIGDDEDGSLAQKPFWSSPVSRSAFFVPGPTAASIANV